MSPAETRPGTDGLSSGLSPALTVARVNVHFGGVAALTEVDLRVWPGTVTGLIGPNGAGKTTLFNVVSGLQQPDRGTVHLFDTDITDMKPHRRARLGLDRTFQRLELFGTLTAGENVQVGLEASLRWWHGMRFRRALPCSVRSPVGAGVRAWGDATDGTGGTTATAADRLLAEVGLEGMADHQASAMPTGFARVVELARGLALRPKLLLLDEPGSGLDESESQALGTLLVRLASTGMAVLLVEHDMELVMRICDTIHVLDFGHVIATGTPEEIRCNPLVQAAYLGAAANPDPGSGTATPHSVR